MKRILLLLFLVSGIIPAETTAQAQSKDSVYLFNAVQIKPIFPGGMQFFNQFLAENFVVPQDEAFQGGKMLVDFVIDTTGTLTDVRILRDIGFNTADQAKFILSHSEKWIPGKQDGLKVKVRYAMPISLPAAPPKGPIYDAKMIESRPEYPGGIEAFYKCIAKNYQLPKQSGLKGKIFISFVIEKDGSVTDVKLIRDIGYGTGPEAVRVLKICGNWIPGQQEGQPVQVLYSLPINIQGT